MLQESAKGHKKVKWKEEKNPNKNVEKQIKRAWETNYSGMKLPLFFFCFTFHSIQIISIPVVALGMFPHCTWKQTQTKNLLEVCYRCLKTAYL